MSYVGLDLEILPEGLTTYVRGGAGGALGTGCTAHSCSEDLGIRGV